MKLDTPNKLSPITVILHWVIALTIIGMLVIGVYMTNTESYNLYPWHKSIGFVIFFTIIIRVIWRIRNGWPTPVGKHLKIEHQLARIAHWVLILCTVLMPVSGFLMSALGGHGVDVFGFEIVARNTDPENLNEVLMHNEAIASLSYIIHGVLGKVLGITLVLHISGALKHHFLDKDGTLRRMFGLSI